MTRPTQGDRVSDREARQAWKRLSASDRAEVLRLAKAGQTHPDSTVAEVANVWATEFLAAGWWNRVPGWLLPLIAVCLAVALWFVHPALSAVAVLGAVAGLLGWSQARAARQILAASTAARPTP